MNKFLVCQQIKGGEICINVANICTIEEVASGTNISFINGEIIVANDYEEIQEIIKKENQ